MLLVMVNFYPFLSLTFVSMLIVYITLVTPPLSLVLLSYLLDFSFDPNLCHSLFCIICFRTKVAYDLTNIIHDFHSLVVLLHFISSRCENGATTFIFIILITYTYDVTQHLDFIHYTLQKKTTTEDSWPIAELVQLCSHQCS